MECGKAPSVVRKAKKKQVKDELDRIKQAEKKKRRLEKALAASAAIISELEKKNQKKKEEQQRLDQECAAIAEAVALQVLGEEQDIFMQQEEDWHPWGYYARNFDLFAGDNHARTSARVIPHSHLSGSPNGDMGLVSEGFGGRVGRQWNGYGLSDDGYLLNDVQAPYVVERDWEAADVSHAISSLRIADDGVNAFVYNRMLRG